MMVKLPIDLIDTLSSRKEITYRAFLGVGKYIIRGGGHFDTFTGPMLFCGYRPNLLIYFDEMLYGSLY